MKKVFLLFTSIICFTHINAQSLSNKEEKFIKHVATISILETKIGDLAEANALSVEVKATAKRLADDYRRVTEQITALSAKKNITIATSLSTKEEKFYNYFVKKQGKDFDKAYLKCTSKANKKGICKVKKINKHAKDADLKEWSAQMLSTLEIHKTLLKQTCENAKKVDK